MDWHHFPIGFLSGHSAVLSFEHLDGLLEEFVVELVYPFIQLHHHGEFVVEWFGRERVVAWKPCVLWWEEHCGEAEGGGSLRVELLGLGNDRGQWWRTPRCAS